MSVFIYSSFVFVCCCILYLFVALFRSICSSFLFVFFLYFLFSILYKHIAHGNNRQIRSIYLKMLDLILFPNEILYFRCNCCCVWVCSCPSGVHVICLLGHERAQWVCSRVTGSTSSLLSVIWVFNAVKLLDQKWWLMLWL